mmetsp:Transcript_4300/g.6557  ORF Transcript_4300/g.6557 Transcript_4300/m.6557 type:complete len:205 (-) Transcript_4300:545-1159(-)
MCSDRSILPNKKSFLSLSATKIKSLQNPLVSSFISSFIASALSEAKIRYFSAFSKLSMISKKCERFFSYRYKMTLRSTGIVSSVFECFKFRMFSSPDSSHHRDEKSQPLSAVATICRISFSSVPHSEKSSKYDSGLKRHFSPSQKYRLSLCPLIVTVRFFAQNSNSFSNLSTDAVKNSFASSFPIVSQMSDTISLKNGGCDLWV